MITKHTPERVLLKELDRIEKVEIECRRYWGGIGFVLGLAIGVSGMAYTEKPTPVVDLGTVTCYANPSSFLVIEGWLRVYDVDRMTVSKLTGNGQAEMQWLPTLVCYDVAPDNEYRAIVHEWWWKRL